jgi:uncharacterized DUF497 family protein
MEMRFEWDENKDRANYEKHGIAFSVAVRIFRDECFIYESPRQTIKGKEMRYVAVGEVAGKIIAAVYTERHEKIRIISARRAWKKEERAYRTLLGGQSA